MKTYTAKPADIEKKWWVIDAEDIVLGRLASQAAQLLRGKHKPMFTPHMDCGDHVIVINADKVHLTGRKQQNKTYYRHTGYPGGIRSTTPEKILQGPHAERVVEMAVRRMISRNPLGRKQMTHLHVYAGSEHKHEAQKPEVLDLKAKNPKNSKKEATS